MAVLTAHPCVTQHSILPSSACMPHLGGILNLQALPAEEIQSIRHSRRGGDHACAVLLLQALQEYLHVQQAQEAARGRSQVGQRMHKTSSLEIEWQLKHGTGLSSKFNSGGAREWQQACCVFVRACASTYHRTTNAFA